MLEEDPANDIVSQTLVHSKHGEIVMKITLVLEYSLINIYKEIHCVIINKRINFVS